jgi:hypothetical protein
MSYEELISKKNVCPLGKEMRVQGYDATSSVVAYFPSNELEELRTQEQHHILKCTSVKTSEFARIKICMGEHV